MSITFHPDRGAILICDYGGTSTYQPPEMMKKRPVVVISPRRRTGQVVSVVPLSSTPPASAEPWHHALPPGSYPPARGPMWAKCDMIAAVALARLDRVKYDGRFQVYELPPGDLAAVLAGLRAAFGFH